VLLVIFVFSAFGAGSDNMGPSAGGNVDRVEGVLIWTLAGLALVAAIVGVV